MGSDVKASLADLTKLPAKEFEQHFQEWMERDEVARALQAKLRFDLIKNFNKTHLGKQMMVQNLYSNVSGSAYRLTLSPLILSLNTLVAEFLYASNCHYALSVFCTEVQFRNVLPDFERMKDFRFNDLEIKDIWEAITGSSPFHKNLHRSVAKLYHAEYQNSLLLAVLKFLITQGPDEMLKRTIEVQTDLKKYDKATKAISTQVSDSGDHVSSSIPLPRCKSKCKMNQEESTAKFKKYIQILSHHVSVMIDKFDELAELKKSFGKLQRSKSIRFRDYQMMGRSLERISQNIKLSAFAKRRNKKQQILLQAIENLTVEFNKCAEQFKDLQKDLKWKKDTYEVPKQSTQDKQTETISVERSYDQWIFEMRNTANGKKFLQRVEWSLRKAMDKHRENVESEIKIRIKHMRSILKLRYKQKLLTCLSTRSFNDDNLEMHKLNENITKKLHEFEVRQMEMLEKMQESARNFHRLNETENIEQSNLNVTSEMAKNQITPITSQIQNEKVYESKLGLVELENESERIEKNFLNYLDRQKQVNIQTDVAQNQTNAAYILELIRKFQHKTEKLNRKSNKDNNFLDMKQHFQKYVQENENVFSSLKPQESVASASSEELENAIVMAKEHFFEEKQRFRQNKLDELLKEMTLKMTNEDNIDRKFETFYTNEKFDNHVSSKDSLNLQIYNQNNNENGANKIDMKENCKIFVEIAEAAASTTTTTVPTTAATEAGAEAATVAQQDSLQGQGGKGETVLKKNDSTVKVFKPIKMTRGKQDNLDNFSSKVEEADIIKKTMNKIQKLFEENSAIIYKKNECQESVVEVETRSSRILSNFTKSLEEHLLPNNKVDKSEEISTAATTTFTENIHLNEKMEKLQRISNISMPSFIDITSSTSSDNLESDVDVITARQLI